ncbi:hypothetical protein IWW48_003147 [Coemansia sp. RSA 1200]|nr:hypothetical protein IWW48_003147 [Coemansia sp. RSA 1200]
MTVPEKTPLLFVRLPRQVVDMLQSTSAEELQFILGGKERITTGVITAGDKCYDVRYSAERASAPPLLYQGGAPKTAASGNWAQWTQRGKLAGKLTLVSKARAKNAPATIQYAQTQTQAQSDEGGSTAVRPPVDRHSQMHAFEVFHGANKAISIPGETGSVTDANNPITDPLQKRATASKAAPQKKPGILRQNREMLRERLMHILALTPVEESLILEKFSGPKSIVLETLEMVGKKVDGDRWALQNERFRDIKIETWPRYSASDRERVISNAINAFKSLGLSEDDPLRVSVLRIRRRLREEGSSSNNGVAGVAAATEGTAAAQVPETSPVKTASAQVPVAASTQGDVARVPKGPTVASISLPKELPTHKRKPSRSVIAPTLVRKVQLGASKAAKRMGLGGVHTNSTPSVAESSEMAAPTQQQNQGLSRAKDKAQRSISRPGRPAPLQSTKDGGIRADSDADAAAVRGTDGDKEPPAPQTARSEAASTWQQMSSTHNKAVNMTTGNNSNIGTTTPEAAAANPRKGLVPSRSTNDIHSEPRQKQAAEHGNAGGGGIKDEQGPVRHVAMKSKPLKLDSAGIAALHRSPGRSRNAETDAAVSRVQERLAQEMASSERRLPGLNIHGNSKTVSGARQQRTRGPSLSPIADIGRSQSPSPVPRIERPETLEEVADLQKMLVVLYAEYSQLRVKIDAHSSEFAPVAEELNAALEQADDAQHRGRGRRKSRDRGMGMGSEREEGEEETADGLAETAAASSKCTDNGARLYWADSGGEAWLSDSPDAVVVVGQAEAAAATTTAVEDKAGQTCRMRRLRGEETRILRANQAVVDKYAELDGDDARRWVRRYQRLHTQIEQMGRELNDAHARIGARLVQQLGQLRAELGDSSVDAVLGELSSKRVAQTLTIGMYRDDAAEPAVKSGRQRNRQNMLRAPSPEYTELADLSAPPSAGVGRERFLAADVHNERELDHEQEGAAHQHGGRQRRSVSALLRDASFRRQALMIVVYTLLWYGFSGVLSVYNKWLFGSSERDFPFPLFVTSVHMFVQYMLATLCLRAYPALRPQQQSTWDVYLVRAVPCGVASALDIGLSNISLQTITLTFYTMCKSSTLGFVLLFAVLFGLERMRLVLVAIIAVISVGVVLMAAGEVGFALGGFLEALGSSAMGGLRWSLTQILLSQPRFGMDNPVATMSKLTPIIGCTTFLFSLILERPFSEIPANKNMESAHASVLLVLVMALGGVLAFAMVLAEFCLIQRTSVLTLSIAGMLREVAMVGVAHLVFGDSMTPVNAAGLLVALAGIAMYNWLKIHDTLRRPPHAAVAADVASYPDDSFRMRQAALLSVDPYDEAMRSAVLPPNALHAARSASPDPAKNNSPNLSPSPSPGSDSLGSSFSNGATTRRRQSILPVANPLPSASAYPTNNSNAVANPSGSLERDLEASLLSGMHDMALSSIHVPPAARSSPRSKEAALDPLKTK